MRTISIGFFVSLVVEWQIPILLARVRFPDEELFYFLYYKSTNHSTILFQSFINGPSQNLQVLRAWIMQKRKMPICPPEREP